LAEASLEKALQTAGTVDAEDDEVLAELGRVVGKAFRKVGYLGFVDMDIDPGARGKGAGGHLGKIVASLAAVRKVPLSMDFPGAVGFLKMDEGYGRIEDLPECLDGCEGCFSHGRAVERDEDAFEHGQPPARI
jgi:hypothetical protein